MKQRYQRHSLIDWFDQDVLAAQAVVVIGAGATGNEVLKNLALLGVGKIAIYDFDLIEAHNLTRSVLFREGDVGEPKAAIAARRAAELDPNVRLEGFHGDFWDLLSFEDLRRASSVIACVDNLEARIRINRLCALLRVDLINTGIDSRSSLIERFPFSEADRCACYECSLPITAYETIAQRYSCGSLRRVAQSERKIPTTIITASASASIAVSAHLKARSLTPPGVSTRTLLDTASGHTTLVEISQRADCPGCRDLEKPRVAFRARRQIEEEAWLSQLPKEGDLTLYSSEPIVVCHRCKGCSTPGDEWHVVMESARKHDQTLADCPRCGSGARQVRIQDQFFLSQLVRDFGGYNMPGKFLTCEVGDEIAVIELLEETNGGSHDSLANGGPDA